MMYSVDLTREELLSLIKERSVKLSNGCSIVTKRSWKSWHNGYPGITKYNDGCPTFTTLARIVNNTEKGLVTRHLCHRKACIDEDHLISGTKEDNLRDNDYRPFEMPLTYDDFYDTIPA